MEATAETSETVTVPETEVVVAVEQAPEVAAVEEVKNQEQQEPMQVDPSSSNTIVINTEVPKEEVKSKGQKKPAAKKVAVKPKVAKENINGTETATLVKTKAISKSATADSTTDKRKKTAAAQGTHQTYQQAEGLGARVLHTPAEQSQQLHADSSRGGRMAASSGSTGYPPSRYTERYHQQQQQQQQQRAVTMQSLIRQAIMKSAFPSGNFMNSGRRLPYPSSSSNYRR